MRLRPAESVVTRNALGSSPFPLRRQVGIHPPPRPVPSCPGRHCARKQRTCGGQFCPVTLIAIVKMRDAICLPVALRMRRIVWSRAER